MRVLLRHDTSMGCIGYRHIIPGTVLGVYDYADGTGKWFLVEFDDLLSDGTWDPELDRPGAPSRRLVLMRSRWRAFEIGDRWPTSVEVFTVALARAAPGLQAGRPTRGLRLAECLCFTESSPQRYASELDGMWHGPRPQERSRGRA